MTFRGPTLIDVPLGGETRFVPDNGGGRPEKGRSGLRGTALMPPFQLPAALLEEGPRKVLLPGSYPNHKVLYHVFPGCQGRVW